MKELLVIVLIAGGTILVVATEPDPGVVKADGLAAEHKSGVGLEGHLSCMMSD